MTLVTQKGQALKNKGQKRSATIFYEEYYYYYYYFEKIFKRKLIRTKESGREELQRVGVIALLSL